MSNATAMPTVTKRHRRIAKKAVGSIPPESQLSAEDKEMLSELLAMGIAGSEGDDSDEDGGEDAGDNDGDGLAGLSEDAADDTQGQVRLDEDRDGASL